MTLVASLKPQFDLKDSLEAEVKTREEISGLCMIKTIIWLNRRQMK